VATLDKVGVDITAVLGTTSMPIYQVLRLGRSVIIELAASDEDAVSILANNLPVAGGGEWQPYCGQRGRIACSSSRYAIIGLPKGLTLQRK